MATQQDMSAPDRQRKAERTDGMSKSAIHLARRSGRSETEGVSSAWVNLYGDRHRPVRIMVPGSRDGRSGRVSFFERNGNLLLRWREVSKDRSDLVRVSEHADPMAEALRRAAWEGLIASEEKRVGPLSP